MAPAPAAPPGLIPFAAAALPADPAEFALPTEWQDIYPLPPDSADSSISNEFYDAASANSTQDGATALGEDDIRLEGEGTEDYSTDRLEADSGDHHAQPRTSPPFRGFAPPPAAARRRVTFSPQLHYFEEEDEPNPGEQEAQPPSEPEESAPLEEELEETSLKLMKLTRRVLALTNRHSSTTRFSRRLTDIWKRQSALYKLCKELRRSNSSDSGHSSSDGPRSSGTNSIGPNDIYDPRRWRPSDTADSSPISSPQPEGRYTPQPEGRYTPTPLHLLPPPAHPPSNLPGLASRFRDALSFRHPEPEPLDLSCH